MSMQTDQPQAGVSMAPARIASDREKRGCGRYVLVGCGVLVVLGLIGSGLFVGVMYFGGRSVEPNVAAYFDHVGKGEYGEIYDEAHPKLQAIITRDNFVQMEQYIHEMLGDLSSRSLNGINISTDSGQTKATATYRGEFAKGEAEVQFDFLGEGKDWKLAGVNYRSSLLP